jgi:hypothetical protein
MNDPLARPLREFTRLVAIEAMIADGAHKLVRRDDEATYAYFHGLATGYLYGYETGYKQHTLEALTDQLKTLTLELAKTEGRILH